MLLIIIVKVIVQNEIFENIVVIFKLLNEIFILLVLILMVIRYNFKDLKIIYCQICLYMFCIINFNLKYYGLFDS